MNKHSDNVLEPPSDLAEDVADMPTALTTSEVRDARDMYVEKAHDLYVALAARYPKFADHLTAHNGSRSLEKDPNSRVEFRGHDRSKMGTLARESRKKRAMEKLESSNIDEEHFTPKKRVNDLIGPNWRRLANIGVLGQIRRQGCPSDQG